MYSGQENGFYQGFKEITQFSMNFAHQKIDNFLYTSVWEEYRTEPHQTVMDVSTNFVEYL